MTPIERAARALCRALNENPDEIVPIPKGLQQAVSTMIATEVARETRWESRASAIRGVLRAMHDPSVSMVSAMVERGAASGYTDVVGLWRAAIDAALAESG